MKLFIGEINNELAILNDAESHHFTKVLRGKLNDEIYVTNGLGKLVKGKVTQLHHKSVQVLIDEIWENYGSRNYYLHIAIAPTKNMDRLSFFLEKATEIGIDEITFLHCFNSERKNINLERCQKIVSGAVKQSIKTYVPKLNNVTKLSDFITSENNDTKLIAHCFEDLPRTELKSVIKPQQNITILIGPEGDFSIQEVELALNNNYQSVSLGKQRLRTETAALYTVFATNWVN